MTLEAALPRPGSRTYSYGDEYGEIDDFEQYTVNVGRARADVCTICGAAVDSEVCGAMAWDDVKDSTPRESVNEELSYWTE